MKHIDQLKAFAGELEALILRYRREFELLLASFVGVLSVQNHALIKEALEDEEQPSEDEG